MYQAEQRAATQGASVGRFCIGTVQANRRRRTGRRSWRLETSSPPAASILGTTPTM